MDNARFDLQTSVNVTEAFQLLEQLLIDFARQYSPHSQAVEKPGVRKLSDIKLMKEDPEGVEKSADEVKRRYAEIFKV